MFQNVTLNEASLSFIFSCNVTLNDQIHAANYNQCFEESAGNIFI